MRPNAAKFLLQPDGFALEGRLAALWPAPYLNFVRNKRSEAAAPFGVRRLIAAFPADLLPPSLQHARPIQLEPAASCRYAGQWNVTAKRRQVTAEAPAAPCIFPIAIKVRIRNRPIAVALGSKKRRHGAALQGAFGAMPALHGPAASNLSLSAIRNLYSFLPASGFQSSVARCIGILPWPPNDPM